MSVNCIRQAIAQTHSSALRVSMQREQKWNARTQQNVILMRRKMYDGADKWSKMCAVIRLLVTPVTQNVPISFLGISVWKKYFLIWCVNDSSIYEWIALEQSYIVVIALFLLLRCSSLYYYYVVLYKYLKKLLIMIKIYKLSSFLILSGKYFSLMFILKTSKNLSAASESFCVTALTLGILQDSVSIKKVRVRSTSLNAVPSCPSKQLDRTAAQQKRTFPRRACALTDNEKGNLFDSGNQINSCSGSCKRAAAEISMTDERVDLQLQQARGASFFILSPSSAVILSDQSYYQFFTHCPFPFKVKDLCVCVCCTGQVTSAASSLDTRICNYDARTLTCLRCALVAAPSTLMRL